MSGALVGDLGVGGEIWLMVSLLVLMTLFFKFSRVISLRNLDLFLLFALSPGMMILVEGSGRESDSFIAYCSLLGGSLLWLLRCLSDVGLGRRPLLEPNLNAAGLAFFGTGILILLIAETVSLPVRAGEGRNPAETGFKPTDKQTAAASKNVALKPL